MNHRQFVVGLGAAPFAAGAAAQPLRPLVAILSPASPRNEMAMRTVHQPFKEALRKLGRLAVWAISGSQFIDLIWCEVDDSNS